MLCKDCKYWQDGIEHAPEEFGYCNSDKFEDISERGISERIYEKDMLLSEDHESYASTVYVGKNFGCIHFEKKEDKE